MNRIILTGRLTDAVSHLMTDKKVNIAKGTIAVKKLTKDDNGNYQTTFIDFTAFNNQAEILIKYTKKGSLILIDGALDVSTYEKDGAKKKRYYVVVNNIELLETKKSSQDEQEEQPKEEPKQNNLPDVPDDDLPF